MDAIRISKSRLLGQVKLSGAKNSALRLLAASILTDETVELYNSPNGLLDMQVHIKMLNRMGKTCIQGDRYLKIAEDTINSELLWSERSIRNSLLILGALTTRFGEVKCLYLEVVSWVSVNMIYM
jgi:UDP-N-acetylglucosamine 1-carboxyvinyltransferase